MLNKEKSAILWMTLGYGLRLKAFVIAADTLLLGTRNSSRATFLLSIDTNAMQGQWALKILVG